MIRETACPGNRLNDFVLILEKERFRRIFTPELVRASYKISKIKQDLSKKKRIRLAGEILSEEGFLRLNKDERVAVDFYYWSDMKKYYHRKLDVARSEIFYGLRRHILRCDEKTPCLERYDNFLEQEVENYISEIQDEEGLSLFEIERLKGPETYDKLKAAVDLKHLCVSLSD